MTKIFSYVLVSIDISISLYVCMYFYALFIEFYNSEHITFLLTKMCSVQQPPRAVALTQIALKRELAPSDVKPTQKTRERIR